MFVLTKQKQLDLNIQNMTVQDIKAKALFLLFILACLTLQQQSPPRQQALPRQQVTTPQTVQQVPVGKWLSPEDSKQKNFPRYLICGAEMNYFRRTMNFSCKATTKPHTLPVKYSCVGGKPIWERCNGIKIKYCNFEDWEDQKVNLLYGSWEYTGMRMCPKNSYVIDYMTRINENDGLTGLYLTCRNKFSDEVSRVVVKEGVGELLGPEFKVPVPKQYAYDYMLKVQNQADGGSYITGLNLAFIPFPEITNITITYDSLPPFDIRPEYFLSSPIRYDNLNTNKTDRIEIFDANKFMNELKDNRAKRLNPSERVFTYALANSKGKYHGYPISRHFRNTFKEFLLLQPILATRLEQNEINDIDRSVIFKNVPMAPDFQFGKTFPRAFPNYPLSNYTIPYCFRLELRVTIYTVFVNNPYTLSITYSSGGLSYVQQIRGVYQGTLFGRPEIEDDNLWIC